MFFVKSRFCVQQIRVEILTRRIIFRPNLLLLKWVYNKILHEYTISLEPDDSR